MGKVYVFDYFLIQYKLIYIWNEEIGMKDFREFVDEVVIFMVFEIICDFFLEEVDINILVQIVKLKVILGKKLGVVLIFRVGLGMVEGILKLIFVVKVGYVGLYCDFEILKFVEYYVKFFFDVEECEFIVVDLMLVIGGFVVEVIYSFKKCGVKNICFMCFVVVLEGVEELQKYYLDVDIYIVVFDEKLNEKGYIVSGFGDVGDCMFGIK